MVEICLKLKRIFRNSLGILVNFGTKIQRKIEGKCEIKFWENSGMYMVAKGVENEVKNLAPLAIYNGTTYGVKKEPKVVKVGN